MKKSIILLLVPFLSFCQLEKYENFMPTSLTGEVGHQQYYSFSFSKKYESSEWTIYYSNKKTLEYKYPRQNLRFRDNPDYPEYDNRDFAAYYRSGYDRGHMVPARSMSFDSDQGTICEDINICFMLELDTGHLPSHFSTIC